jgi:mannose-1-phosphate guanylyltransferase
MKKHQYAVMMAGGIGSRFWPLSQKQIIPNSFLDILGTGKSLCSRAMSACQKHSLKTEFLSSQCSLSVI